MFQNSLQIFLFTKKKKKKMLKNSLEEPSILKFAEKYKSKLTPLRQTRVFPSGPHAHPHCVHQGTPTVNLCGSLQSWLSYDLICPVKYSLVPSIFFFFVGSLSPLLSLNSILQFSKAKLLSFLMTPGLHTHTPARSLLWCPLGLYVLTPVLPQSLHPQGPAQQTSLILPVRNVLDLSDRQLLTLFLSQPSVKKPLNVFGDIKK